MNFVENQGRPKQTKNGKIATFYLERTTDEGLTIIARREGVSKSSLGRKVLDEYVKAHLSGNTQYLLTQDYEKMSAYPTPWDGLDLKKLKGNTWKEDDEMLEKLEAAKGVLMKDRQVKRDNELKAKGISLR